MAKGSTRHSIEGAIMAQPIRNVLDLEQIYVSLPPAKILVVDDMTTNRGLVKAVLRPPEFDIYEAASGEEALDIIAEREFDAILLDIIMPGLDGLEVCRRIRTDLGLSLLPVIMVTSMGSPDDIVQGMEVGATDYVTKPFHSAELLARMRSAVEHKRLTDRLDDTESVLFALARLVEAKDGSTGDHCDRLQHLAMVFGNALGLPYEDLEALRRGGVLHDIGKVAIPDAVLLKRGPLSDEEWVVMKQHPMIGTHLCSPLNTMKRTVDIVRCHHEKWNGNGYPAGLAGEDIPLLARVFQIVDCFDALSSERPYKKAFELPKVISILEEETAKGFWDPELMPIFLDIVRNRPEALTLPKDRVEGRDVEIYRGVAGLGTGEWERR